MFGHDKFLSSELPEARFQLQDIPRNCTFFLCMASMVLDKRVVCFSLNKKNVGLSLFWSQKVPSMDCGGNLGMVRLCLFSVLILATQTCPLHIFGVVTLWCMLARACLIRGSSLLTVVDCLLACLLVYRLVFEDSDHTLFTVTLFRKVADEFKMHAREHK